MDSGCVEDGAGAAEGRGAEVKVLIDADAVQRRIGQVANALAASYGDQAPILIGVLNGAAFFMMALLERLPAAWQQELQYDFVDLSSYQGSKSGQVRLHRDLVLDIAGRDVVVVDGIVDTGHTLAFLRTLLEDRRPRSLAVCALLDKPSKRQVGVDVDYCGFEIDDLFVVGCGMDLDQRYRALPFVGVLEG